MSNIDKAARIVRDLSEVDGETIGYAHAHNIARALADAGLLAEDLPEPDLDHRDPAHRAEFEAWWEGPVPDVWNKGLPDVFTVQVFPDKPEVGLYLDLEPLEPFSPQEARKLAYSLLAAANYTEEE